MVAPRQNEPRRHQFPHVHSNGQIRSRRGLAGHHPSTAAQEDAVPDGPINEREARKRRRLEAFRRVPTRVKTSLHPVEVEGKGRVLLDVGAEEVSELLEELQSSAAGKKRGAKKRRRVGPGSRGGKTRTVREETKPPSVREGVPLDWPDEEFPWNVRTHERRELEAAEEADRMQWIGRFLDEDSDAKSSEATQDEDVPPIRLDQADPSPVHAARAWQDVALTEPRWYKPAKDFITKRPGGCSCGPTLKTIRASTRRSAKTAHAVLCRR
jgi:hypothetical protein